jgi:hypothetical protein
MVRIFKLIVADWALSAMGRISALSTICEQVDCGDEGRNANPQAVFYG